MIVARLCMQYRNIHTHTYSRTQILVHVGQLAMAAPSIRSVTLPRAAPPTSYKVVLVICFTFFFFFFTSVWVWLCACAYDWGVTPCRFVSRQSVNRFVYLLPCFAAFACAPWCAHGETRCEARCDNVGTPAAIAAEALLAWPLSFIAFSVLGAFAIQYMCVRDHNRSSKICHCLTWIFTVSTLTLTLLRSLFAVVLSRFPTLEAHIALFAIGVCARAFNLFLIYCYFSLRLQEPLWVYLHCAKRVCRYSVEQWHSMLSSMVNF